jgi:hypothetical protein
MVGGAGLREGEGEMMWDHKCPTCGNTCVYDREGHRCLWCKQVHCAPTRAEVLYPEGWNAPNTDPVRDAELEACVAVAELHALAAQGFYYLGYHQGNDDGLHMIVQYRRTVLEIQEHPGHNSITDAYQRMLGVLAQNKPGWSKERGQWEKANLRDLHLDDAA